MRSGGENPDLCAVSRTTLGDLTKEYDIVDFGTGAKLTGSGFRCIKEAANWQRALVQYFLDLTTSQPAMQNTCLRLWWNEASAYGTRSAHRTERQMYHIQLDNFIDTCLLRFRYQYLSRRGFGKGIRSIAHQNDNSLFTVLQMKREVLEGDVRGLNRVHQFEKVEIVQLTHPDKSMKHWMRWWTMWRDC